MPMGYEECTPYSVRTSSCARLIALLNKSSSWYPLRLLAAPLLNLSLQLVRIVAIERDPIMRQYLSERAD